MNAKATTPPAPEPTKRTKSAPDSFASAGKLARRFADLDQQEAAELAASPQTIRAKYTDKRATAADGYSAEVVTMAKAMLGAGKKADDEAPESE